MGLENKKPEINIQATFNEGLNDQSRAIKNRHQRAAVEEPLQQAKEQLKDAERAAEISLITFLRNLNDIKGFTVCSHPNNCAPLGHDPEYFYIYYQCEKVSARITPAIKGHISNALPVYAPDNNDNDNDNADDDDKFHRYVLLGNSIGLYEGGKRTVPYGEKKQGDKYLELYDGKRYNEASVYYTSYLPDFVDELVYSLARIGVAHSEDLEKEVEYLQLDFQKSFSAAYEQNLEVQQCEQDFNLWQNEQKTREHQNVPKREM